MSQAKEQWDYFFGPSGVITNAKGPHEIKVVDPVKEMAKMGPFTVLRLYDRLIQIVDMASTAEGTSDE